MALLLVIDADARKCHRIDEAILGTQHRLLSAETLTRGLELCRTGSPDLVFVGTPNDADSLSAIAHIRREADAKETPIVLLSDSVDPQAVPRLKQLSVMGVVSAEAPLDVLRRKVFSAVSGAEKIQVQHALKRAHHVQVRRAAGRTTIAVFSNLREYALAELKVVLNPFFLKLVRNDALILDLRHVPEIPSGDARLVEQIVTVLGGPKVILLSGKHLGTLIEHTELSQHNRVLLTEEEVEGALKSNPPGSAS